MKEFSMVCRGCGRMLMVGLGRDLEGHGIYNRAAVAAVLMAKKEIVLPQPNPITAVYDYAVICSVACGRVVLAPGSGWEALTRDKITNPKAVRECSYWINETPYAFKWDARSPPGGPLPEEPTTDVQRHVTKTRRVSQFVDGVGMVSHLLAEYIDRLDQLRGLRAEQRGPYAEMGINDDIGRIRAAMPRDENEFAETLWWRAWPAEFTSRQPAAAVG